jgi:hypothetical protein
VRQREDHGGVHLVSALGPHALEEPPDPARHIQLDRDSLAFDQSPDAANLVEHRRYLRLDLRRIIRPAPPDRHRQRRGRLWRRAPGFGAAQRRHAGHGRAAA